jgi:hypothetical protein
MTAWVNCQYLSLIYREKYPDNYHIIRFEDIVKDKVKSLSSVLEKMGVGSSRTLAYPSWNGKRLKEVYPWGTVRIPTEEANLMTAMELEKREIKEIYERTKTYIDLFDFVDIHERIG